MWVSSFRSALLAALCAAFISGYHSLSYDDLEVLGVNCPSRDSCLDYRNNLTSLDRNCACDYKCTGYEDCCIDALTNEGTQSSRPPPRTDVTCLHYVHEYYKKNTGVYVINKCSSSWNGPREVREQCVGADSFSDPLTSAPATDVVQNKTYRNLACAECNNADLTSLITFVVKLRCDKLRDELLEFTEDQIIENLTYSQQHGLWGVYRLNKFDNETKFISCDVIHDVPIYIYNSVRFCRPNLVSSCVTNWTRPTISRLCAQYMAVVYSMTHAYRNPHCAICNHKTLDDVYCLTPCLHFGRRRPAPIHLFSLDVNRNDGYELGTRRVATPECTSGHKYDPFFKKCRQLVCSLPRHDIVGDRCVRE